VEALRRAQASQEVAESTKSNSPRKAIQKSNSEKQFRKAIQKSNSEKQFRKAIQKSNSEKQFRKAIQKSNSEMPIVFQTAACYPTVAGCRFSFGRGCPFSLPSI
jgi:3-dehydroquinate dehydratase